jgi:hypothetical protein
LLPVAIVKVSLSRLRDEDVTGRARRTHEEKRNAYRILVRKSEGKRKLGRPGRRLEDNIKIGLR